MTNQITETVWTDWIFGLTISAGGWLALWGGVLGAFAAVLIAIWYERHLERKREKQALSRLSNALQALCDELSPYRDKVIVRDVETEKREDLISLWQHIVAVDSVVQWAMTTPALLAFEDWNEIAHLGASFDNEGEAIAANRVSIPQEGLVSFPEYTGPIARHLVPRLQATIDAIG